jgi:hypothetical protein
MIWDESDGSGAVIKIRVFGITFPNDSIKIKILHFINYKALKYNEIWEVLNYRR